jgi:hypothetical protein
MKTEAKKELNCDLCDRDDEGIVFSKALGLIKISVCEKCLSGFFQELGRD